MKTETVQPSLSLGYIYRYTNQINGMTYIGQTWDIANRRKYHESLSSKSCPRFLHALKKHGVDAFDFDIITTATNQGMLDALEMCYITVLNTLSPNGYNLKTGGYGGKHSDETKAKVAKAQRLKWEDDKYREKGLKQVQEMSQSNIGKHRSIETRTKMSESSKGKAKSIEARQNMSKAQSGKKRSPKTRAKMSKSRTGEQNHMYGKKHTPDAIKKMSEAKRGMNHPMYGKRRNKKSSPLQIKLFD